MILKLCPGSLLIALSDKYLRDAFQRHIVSSIWRIFYQKAALKYRLNYLMLLEL